MVLTSRDDLALHLRELRDHGSAERYRHVRLGFCSRLDELQAALLRVKLRRLPAWTEARRRIAERYRELLADAPLGLPVERPPARHVYHQFTVRASQRDALAKRLAEAGVGTAVHYPLPIPGQPLFERGPGGAADWPRAWQAAREVLSLPCFPELADAEVEAVGRAVRRALE
jgi:dTDP-4-amino-4,6-dideoxygalactose transaminase